MNRSSLSLIAITLAAFSAAPAMAADAHAPDSRHHHVQTELAEAVRTGQLLADGESGLKRNELFPGNYPARSTEPGKTRAQVQAELFEAIRTGTMPVHSGA